MSTSDGGTERRRRRRAELRRRIGGERGEVGADVARSRRRASEDVPRHGEDGPGADAPRRARKGRPWQQPSLPPPRGRGGGGRRKEGAHVRRGRRLPASRSSSPSPPRPLRGAASEDEVRLGRLRVPRPRFLHGVVLRVRPRRRSRSLPLSPPARSRVPPSPLLPSKDRRDRVAERGRDASGKRTLARGPRMASRTRPSRSDAPGQASGRAPWPFTLGTRSPVAFGTLDPR